MADYDRYSRFFDIAIYGVNWQEILTLFLRYSRQFVITVFIELELFICFIKCSKVQSVKLFYGNFGRMLKTLSITIVFPTRRPSWKVWPTTWRWRLRITIDFSTESMMTLKVPPGLWRFHRTYRTFFKETLLTNQWRPTSLNWLRGHS